MRPLAVLYLAVRIMAAVQMAWHGFVNQWRQNRLANASEETLEESGRIDSTRPVGFLEVIYLGRTAVYRTAKMT